MKSSVIESKQQGWQWGKLAAGLNSNSNLFVYIKQGKKSQIRTRLDSYKASKQPVGIFGILQESV